jgi:2-polyprenyl-3-methyl-5-hydroxy-6-metoxy-1,4-benzoquinol methylase
MVHHDACPLCSSENITLLFRCTDHFTSKKTFPVFRCAACDFTFTQDYPEENEIGRYYESEDYISHTDSDRGFSNKLYRLARKIMLTRKRGLVRKITSLQTGNILDIGSGTGYFASAMKQSGWIVKGIEINEKARNFAAERFDLEVAPPDDLPRLTSNSYDCITLWHVLEHFHDPVKYLSDIKRLLKPGAVCIVALPNSNSYDAKYYKSYWAAWDVPRHLWHFNPATFRHLAEKEGFRFEKIRSLPLDVFYISQLSEKYRGGSSLGFLKGISKASVFASLALFKKERSSSVIYTLRKTAD